MECVVCQIASETKKCSRCKAVYYCSVDHQKKDWPTHKANCGPFKVVDSEDPVRGKYCIANRDLKAGEVILEEDAAFFSSRLSFPSTCVSCGRYVVDWMFGGALKCTKCGCTVCGLTCEQSPVHVKNECRLFTKYKIKYAQKFGLDASLMFAMIRGAALKTQKPKVYNELLQLQHTSSSESFQKNIDAEVHKFLAGLKSILRSQSLEFDDEIYKRIGQLTLINVFRQVVIGLPVPDEDTEEEFTKYNASMVQRDGRYCIYVKASRFNHSCIPNCTWTIGPAPAFKIRIRVAVPIKQGEELTVCYAGTQPDLIACGTHERQKMLKNDCGVSCECARCADPTEFETFSSAVTCASCKSKLDVNGEADGKIYGYMLAENPLNDTPQSIWKCNICEEELANDIVLKMVNNIRLELKEQFDAVHNMNLLGLAGNVNPFEVFQEKMKKYCGSILHPNHWVTAETVAAISKILGPELDQDSPELSVIERHHQWAEYSLRLSDKMYPGLSMQRAHLLLLLANILGTKIEKFGPTMTKEELTKNYNQFLKSSWDAFQYFMEDFCRPGEQFNYLATSIYLNIEDIQKEWGNKIAIEDKGVQNIFDKLSKRASMSEI